MKNDRKDDELNLLLFQLAPHSICWKTSDVSAEPEIQLLDWTIKEDTAGNRYFVGARADDHDGRVSTPIMEFDPERRRGRTQSGRIYELLGSPGISDNGEYVWSIYKIANNITERGK